MPIKTVLDNTAGPAVHSTHCVADALGTLHNSKRVDRLSLGLQDVFLVDCFYEWAQIVLCLGCLRAFVFGNCNGAVEETVFFLALHLLGVALFALLLDAFVWGQSSLVDFGREIGRSYWFVLGNRNWRLYYE